MTFRHNGTVVWTKAATSDVYHSLAAVVGSKAVATMRHIERNNLEPSVYMQIYLKISAIIMVD